MTLIDTYHKNPYDTLDACLSLSPTYLWGLEESSGTTAVDAGSGAVNGTYTNTGDMTLGVAGPTNTGAGGTSAVHLLGSDGVKKGCVLLPSPVGNAMAGTDFTLSFWFRPTVSGTGYELFSCVTSDGWSQPLQATFITGNFVRIRHGLASGVEATVKTGAIALTNNAWHHVLWVVSGNSGYLYIDGVKDGATADLTGVSRVFSSRPTYIGARNATASQGGNTGDYAQFALWTRALSDTERDTLFEGATLSADSVINVDTDGKYNAWPGLTRSRQTGRLHCSYSKGNSHYQDHSNYAVYRYSDDRGATWSSSTQISPSPDGNYRYLGGGVAALASGRIVYGYWRDGWSAGIVSDQYIKYSDDGGATWSAAVGPLPGWTSGLNYCGGQSLFQSSTGRLFFTIYGTNTGDTAGRYRCGVVYSDDNGLTWSGPVAIGPGNDVGKYSEAVIVQLLNGTLVCFVRSEQSQQWPMFRATSTDDGATWSSLVSCKARVTGAAFDTTPGNPGAVIATAHGGLVVIFYRHYSASAHQFYPAYRLSTDGGATFGAEQLLSSSLTYEYVGATMLDPNTIGVVYGADNPAGQDDVNPGVCDLYFRRIGVTGP